MAVNKTDLILNLARNAPWLIDGGNNVFPEVMPGDIREILGEIRDNRLAVITESGQVYEQYQSLNIINGKIQIDKPFGWRESTGTFYIFLRNKDGDWVYFPAENAVSYPTALLVNPPDKLYHLQKRRYHRVVTPIGTKAIFKGYDNHFDSAHVQDISAGGMLICHNSLKDKYPVDSIINEIFITIPPKARKDEANIARKVTPLISNGKVVRTFSGPEHSISYYGISFLFKSTYAKEGVSFLITYLESLLDNPDFGRNVSSSAGPDCNYP